MLESMVSFGVCRSVSVAAGSSLFPTMWRSLLVMVPCRALVIFSLTASSLILSFNKVGRLEISPPSPWVMDGLLRDRVGLSSLNRVGRGEKKSSFSAIVGLLRDRVGLSSLNRVGRGEWKSP